MALLNEVEEGGVDNAAKGGPRAGGSERITRCEIETDYHRRARAVALATWSVDHCAAWSWHDCRRQRQRQLKEGWTDRREEGGDHSQKAPILLSDSRFALVRRG